jgi:hypothetical protein
MESLAPRTLFLSRISQQCLAIANIGLIASIFSACSCCNDAHRGRPPVCCTRTDIDRRRQICLSVCLSGGNFHRNIAQHRTMYSMRRCINVVSMLLVMQLVSAFRGLQPYHAFSTKQQQHACSLRPYAQVHRALTATTMNIPPALDVKVARRDLLVSGFASLILAQPYSAQAEEVMTTT